MTITEIDVKPCPPPLPIIDTVYHIVLVVSVLLIVVGIVIGVVAVTRRSRSRVWGYVGGFIALGVVALVLTMALSPSGC